ANLVGLAHLFERPANARIARQALAAIGRPLKGGDDDGHRETPIRFASVLSSTSVNSSSGCSEPPAEDGHRAAATVRIGRSPRLAVRVIATRTRSTLEPHRWQFGISEGMHSRRTSYARYPTRREEFIGGIDVVTCADRQQAIEFATEHPLARYHAIEVRPFYS